MSEKHRPYAHTQSTKVVSVQLLGRQDLMNNLSELQDYTNVHHYISRDYAF